MFQLFLIVNNLKETLFEIKQHQQKLVILAQQKRELQQSPTKQVNSFILSSLDVKTLEINFKTYYYSNGFVAISKGQLTVQGGH